MASDLTISAFSRLCGISVSALRFYDQAGVLRPTAVDGSTGYRRYSREQVVGAGRLRDLRRLDFSLDQIRHFEQAPEALQQQLISDQLALLAGRLAQAEATARSLRTPQQRENVVRPLQIDAQALSRAIDQVIPAVSKDDELSTITNLLIEARDGSLRLVGTDRYRLAVRDLMCQSGTPEAFRAVVEPTALRRLQPHLHEGDTALVSIHGDVLRIAHAHGHDELAISGTEYPPYERLLTTGQPEHSLTALRDDVLRGLAQSHADETVLLAFAHDTLTFDTRESVPARYSGEQLSIALRRTFVSDAVTNSVGADIMIEATSPVSPVCFRSADDGSYLCMVMPIRVAETAGA